MKWLYRIVCGILVIVMLVSAWKIWTIMSEYKEGEDAYREIEEFITIPSPTPAPSDAGAEPSVQPTQDPLTQFPVVDFAALQQMNSDVVGWIYIPGTHVNYPIVQGSDNSYYLNRLFTKQWNSAGAIFEDYRNAPDFSDVHSIIYGHRMNNNTMFHDLKLYGEQDFYEQHSVGYLLTPEGTYMLEFFAGYVSSVDSNAWELNLTQGNFDSWVKDQQQRSAFTSLVQPQVGDRVVTLSTCSTAFENARFVLHGVLRQADID